MAFHHLIAEVGGNGYLTGLLDGLASSTVRARLWRGITQKRSVERTLNEHRSIVDALAIGDPRLAESAMIVHIGGVENWIRRAVLDESGAVAEPSGDGE